MLDELGNFGNGIRGETLFEFTYFENRTSRISVKRTAVSVVEPILVISGVMGLYCSY